MDVATAIKNSPMVRRQYIAVASIVAIAVIDGFDITMMGFVLPYLPEGFAAPSMKGYLISSALVGMGIGAVVCGMLADRVGRRKVVLSALVLAVVSMFGAALAPNAYVLMGIRFFTGLAVGALTASAVVLLVEFVPINRRNLAMGLNSLLYASGSVAAGFTGVQVAAAFSGNWRVLFVVGGILSAIALVIAVLFLPESIDFLMRKGSKTSQGKIDWWAKKLGRPDIDPRARPVVHEEDLIKSSLAGLWGRRLWKRTLWIWVAQIGVTSAFYFASSWTPQLVATASEDARLGSIAGTILTIGSAAGAVVFGLLGLKFRAAGIAWASTALCAVSLLAFGAFFGTAAVSLALTVVVGLTAFVGVVGIGAMTPQSYPAAVRGSGYGWALGAARVGAIATPIVTGYLVQLIPANVLYMLAAIPMGAAAFACLRLAGLARTEPLVEEQADPQRLSHQTAPVLATDS